ncbi:MAG: hypothetical protein CMP12_10295 [Zunongwangia sp.]|jgi:hypothetical protein|uniref:Uncharacterized protein n=1 Tax=Zunongwangia profunda (strain DSM 18752 / CCTCC AB 206139 / SM-A87) TaxID=655815 RepID=D5BHZ4_ZUNPS|nr:hypothetical protein [Zunongwangia profunda]ADF51382.1 hypothetical protein ZPR_1037 [Zunongwangia profunda SM-A87]MAO36279.1 hypothetical protein [Zunongwangia sp.]MAS69626.1 hypothetical protein [Zunongwangia sp.]MCC4230101.1 hypothetical protein [Zunongwangia profunda]|tara:strand:+ start:270 stop:458 length:189 start_codon:yes stop_codon:yes gene_type:complete
MIEHDIDHRDQLARLHDRHKRLSLMVYDHLNANEEEEMLKAHKEMKETAKELELLQHKLHGR